MIRLEILGRINIQYAILSKNCTFVNMKKLLFISYLLLIVFIKNLQAQKAVETDTISIPLFSAHLQMQLPGGDLTNRFGYNAAVGGTFTYKTNKNWMWSFEGNFMFGNQIKENNILLSIGTSDSNIIGSNGQLIQVRLLERGFSFMGKGGKLFPVWGPNKNSGLTLLGGIGFLQHKILIENLGDYLPQLSGDYLKGYDRLSNGLALSQFIGYYYFGNKGRANFYVGLECTEAFTKNRRGYNYDSMSYDTANRLDLLYGLKFGWFIPINKKAPDKYYTK